MSASSGAAGSAVTGRPRREFPGAGPGTGAAVAAVRRAAAKALQDPPAHLRLFGLDRGADLASVPRLRPCTWSISDRITGIDSSPMSRSRRISTISSTRARSMRAKRGSRPGTAGASQPSAGSSAPGPPAPGRRPRRPGRPRSIRGSGLMTPPPPAAGDGDRRGCAFSQPVTASTSAGSGRSGRTTLSRTI